eukprot:Skav217970  [mRNA]  locus=scaffold3450:355742:356676:- [translate_table: standard]
MNVTITLLAVEEISPFKELRVVRLRAGDAKTYPIFGDWVTLHLEIYHDGKLLSSTRENGSPLRDLEHLALIWCIWGYHLGLEDLRPGRRGFELGLQEVSLGEEASIYVPAHLAYGARGSIEQQIPPHADLVYKVELLDVESELELAL